MDSKKLEILITAKDNASKKLDGFSGSIETLGKRAAQTATVLGVAFSAAISKFVVAGGISRALNIEDAQAKLRGLGHDVKNIESIMDSALKSVLGTAYGLDQAATISATAIAAGVQQGEKLTLYLKNVADAATIAGTDLSYMGNVFNQIQTIGAAYNDSLRVLAERGLPVYTWLAKELNMTEKAVKDFASEGKISSEQFYKVVQKNIGGAALESGKTTRGAWNNLQAAMARVGAKIADSIIPKIRDSFGNLTKWFDNNSNRIVGAVENMYDSVASLINIFKGWLPTIQNVAKQVGDFLLPRFTALWSTIKDLSPTLEQLKNKILLPLATAFGKALVFSLGLFVDSLNAVLKIANPVIKATITLKDALLALAISVAVYKGFNLLALAYAAIVASAAGVVTAIKSLIATFQIATITMGVFKGSLVSIGALLAANPIGLAITVLAGAFALLNNAINKNADAFEEQMRAQREAAQATAENAANTYKKAADAFNTLANAAMGYNDVLHQITNSEKAVAESQAELTQAISIYGSESQEAKEATARLSAEEAKLSQLQVQRALELEALKEKTDAMERSNGALTNAEAAQLEANIKATQAIRDQMRARGEDTTQINQLIQRLDVLNEKKKVEIDITANTATAISGIQTFKNLINDIPSSKYVNLNVNSTGSGTGLSFMSGGGLSARKAHGGSVTAGAQYLTAERGGELFVPDQKGQVIKNMDARRMMGSEISIVVNNPVFETPQSAEAWWSRMDRDGKLVSMGLSGVR